MWSGYRQRLRQAAGKGIGGVKAGKRVADAQVEVEAGGRLASSQYPGRGQGRWQAEVEAGGRLESSQGTGRDQGRKQAGERPLSRQRFETGDRLEDNRNIQSRPCSCI